MRSEEMGIISLLLQLVRAGMWEDPRQLDGFPPLSEHEWTLLYRESKRQTVSGLALVGVGMLPDPLFPPRALLLRWVARGDRIERTCHRMERDAATLLRTMHEAGLRPLLQKGLAVGRFYPRPRLRVSGDIDLWFDAASRRQADSLIMSLGVPVKLSADGSAVYHWGATEVEHHSDLVELQSPRARRRLEAYTSQPSRTVEVAPGLEVEVAAPIAELLMISVHILKHCFGMGVGLRHFCDYAVARAALMPEIGEERWREACRELGLTRWIGVLEGFTEQYLGDNRKGNFDQVAAGLKGTSSKLPSRLLRLMEEGGNFGLHRTTGSDRRMEGRRIRRKFGTMSGFLRHASLSVRLAPREAVATFLSLAKGNLLGVRS